MKKKKGEITKYFNPSRSHYTDKDGNYVYTYQQIQDDGTYKDVKTVIELTDETVNIIRVLQESDRQMDLQDIYQRRQEDKLIKNSKEENEDGEMYKTMPIENIADKNADIFKILFEEEIEDLSADYDVFMSTLTENQRDLIYDHVNLGKSLAQISKENGNKVSVKAYESRWAKIRKKAISYFKNKV